MVCLRGTTLKQNTTGYDSSKTTESFENIGWSVLQCFHITLDHKSKMAIITRQSWTYCPVRLWNTELSWINPCSMLRQPDVIMDKSTDNYNDLAGDIPVICRCLATLTLEVGICAWNQINSVVRLTNQRQ